MAITETRSGSRAHAEGMPESRPDPEVPAKARRRRYSAEYKLQILEEADRASEPGQVGGLLRREGLYSSHLATWREQRREGTLAGLAQSRGRKARDERDRKIEELERDNARLTKKAGPGGDNHRGPKRPLATAGDRAGDRRGHQELMVQAVNELSPVIGAKPACELLGVKRATLYRTRSPQPARPATPRQPSPRPLSEPERETGAEGLALGGVL